MTETERIKELEARVEALERKIAPTPRAAPGGVSDIGTGFAGDWVTDGLGNIQFVPRMSNIGGGGQS